MTVHHKPAPARAIEHAKSKDSVAGRLLSPAGHSADAPVVAHNTSRGFAAGNVVNGKTVRPQPALDIQPRQGGMSKGYDIEVAHGQRSRTSPLPGMQHMTDVHGVPVADAPDPIDPTVQGKHQPPCMVHPGMTRQQVGAANFNGEDILREAADLPKTVTED